jgi:lipoprotein-anchoring transpeptidase ErfK/SrfK
MHALSALTLVAALAQADPASGRPAKTASGSPATRATKAAALRMEALQQQVMLDRAGFSPGVIDGHGGVSTAKARAAFRKQGTPATPPVDTLSRYRITAEDAAGPYVPIPADMMEKSTLPAMGYASPLEALAERFHSSPALLQQLNPGITFAADQEIQVPNVDPMILPVVHPPKTSAPNPASTAPAGAAASAPPAAPRKPDVVVTVRKADGTLTVTNTDGAVVFHAPVTTGSEHDPLPIGAWTVTGVQRNPIFHYNPELFWDADETHAKAKIPAGPNNPVGAVWIATSKDHYGLHGTPEPEAIGRAESHGCVRLTNWDALRLAALVKPGTRVVFTE